MGDPWLTLPALCPQYFAFLLLILIAQVAAGALFYFNMDKVSTPSLPLALPTCAGPATWGFGLGEEDEQETSQLPQTNPVRAKAASLRANGGLLDRKAVSAGRVAAGPGPLSTPPCCSCVAAVRKLLASLCPLHLL